MNAKTKAPDLFIPTNLTRLINGLSDSEGKKIRSLFIRTYRKAKRTPLRGTSIVIARSNFILRKEVAWMQIGEQIYGNLYESLEDHLRAKDENNPFVFGVRFRQTSPGRRGCKVYADDHFRRQTGLRITNERFTSGRPGQSLIARVSPVG